MFSFKINSFQILSRPKLTQPILYLVVTFLLHQKKKTLIMQAIQFNDKPVYFVKASTIVTRKKKKKNKTFSGKYSVVLEKVLMLAIRQVEIKLGVMRQQKKPSSLNQQECIKMLKKGKRRRINYYVHQKYNHYSGTSKSSLQEVGPGQRQRLDKVTPFHSNSKVCGRVIIG